jgi:NAD(P)H-flavin reductase/ferredoxin
MRFNLSINGQSIESLPGTTLVDAALGVWKIIPHDCRSGQCETCRVTVVAGSVDDCGTAIGRTVLACQARVSGDAEIRFDEIPLPEKRSGAVSEMTLLSPQVVEVVVRAEPVLDYLPGQYVRLKFSGFPAREYSPTVRIDGRKSEGEMVFHIRILPDGVVSSALGTAIGIGHRVHVQGPFGSAFLREGDGPLILVSGGTGWAPIWAIAHAARQTQPRRPTFVIAGSRDPARSYMQPALHWLLDNGVQNVTGTVEANPKNPLKLGRPTHYLPLLGIQDTVYVAGPAGLVDAVKRKAQIAAAQCYADPFLPSGQPLSFADRLRGFLFSRKRQVSVQLAAR